VKQEAVCRQWPTDCFFILGNGLRKWPSEYKLSRLLLGKSFSLSVYKTAKGIDTSHVFKTVHPNSEASGLNGTMKPESRNGEAKPKAPKTMEDVWPRKSHTAWKRYGLAFVTTMVALAIDLVLRTFLNESSIVLYVVAAMLSASYGGFRAGLAVVVMADLTNVLHSYNPHFSLAVGVHGFERLVIFTAVGLLVSWLEHRSRRAEEAFRVINRDLEKRVRARTAALEESNKQLEDFSYSLAHDLRGPLRTMEGFADILNSDHGNELSDDARGCVRKIQLSAQRMGQLILDLLAYTHLARAELKMQKIHLGRLIESVLSRMDGEIKRSGSVINVRNPLPTVVSDLDTLDNALMNLLTNAIKFSRTGGIPRVEVWAEERYAGVTRLWVADNGIGIDPEYQGKIFGLFERLHDKDSYEGTGIGLALVKMGVERMGGRVGVESRPGEGSRFWIELPTDITEKPEEQFA
jgi:signal transduction histidine kinase